MGASQQLNEKLIDAAQGGKLEDVLDLLAQGADVDYFNDEELSKKNTALCMAAQGGHKDVVAALIDAGADLNYRNWAGNTAFSYAACNIHLDLCDLMIEKGADPLVRLFSGGTTLMSLPIFGEKHLEVAEYLLDLGEDILAKDDEGKTALDFAKREPAPAFIDLYETWEAKARQAIADREKQAEQEARAAEFAVEKKAMTAVVAKVRSLPSAGRKLKPTLT